MRFIRPNRVDALVGDIASTVLRLHDAADAHNALSDRHSDKAAALCTKARIASQEAERARSIAARLSALIH